MKKSLILLALASCFSLVAFSRPGVGSSKGSPSEDDVRKMEQNWLNAAAVPDLPTLRKMFSDDFMGTSFGAGVLSKNDVVPPDGISANHMPKSVLRDSTVHIFGNTAVLMGTVEMQVPKKPEQIRMTTVFQQRGDNWQVIAVHMSKSE
jgi:ketosteroid isomerase-like protein